MWWWPLDDAGGIAGEATVTKGIVSAKRYDARYSAQVYRQTLPSNPGNSGGPLLSSEGLVLGIRHVCTDRGLWAR